MLKSFAHAQEHRISTVCGEDNGLCQSPSFLGQEELGSGYEIDLGLEANNCQHLVSDLWIRDFEVKIYLIVEEKVTKKFRL